MNSIKSDTQLVINKIDFTELKNKTVLITGATGLLGTYFLETIAQLYCVGIKVYKLNIVIHNDLPNHLSEFKEYAWVNIIKGDLTDERFCATLPAADYIIHAAGYGQPGKFVLNPVKTLKINTSATFILLEKLKKEGKFLFISTSEVYSGLEKPSYSEEDIGRTTPMSPRSCYIEGKRCGEAICKAYRDNGINVKCARLSLAYGPGTRSDDKRVLNEFIRKAILLKKIELMDMGSAQRTYCYIQDAVEIMWNILLYGKEEVYNVGGHSNITIRGLAEKIAKYFDVPVIIPKELNEMRGAPKDVALSMDKAEREFNKYEFVSLDDGIKSTIDWQKQNLFECKELK